MRWTRRNWWGPAAGLAGGGAALWGLARAWSGSAQGYRVVQSFPHDPTAFCQGLVFADGSLYESTGRYGTSSLRRVELTTGKVLARVDLDASIFAEGLTAWKENLVQLTWQNRVGFIYERASLRQIGQFEYSGEGWGLTHDGESWIMSDGSSTLRRLDPKTGRVIGTIRAKEEGTPLPRLNELEFIEGEIWANVWQSDRLVRIAVDSGDVTGSIDLTGLLEGRSPGQVSPDDRGVDVLNGIAYDNNERRLFVTGKNWPRLFQIDIGRG